METTDTFSQLDERVQRWVWRQGWDGLRPIQANSIPAILSGDRDVIVSAPTAGGKTEAVYLPVLSRIVQEERPEGFQVLALSPLKSLINDQTRRLEEMARDMEVEVTPWHGDVSASKKNSASRSPSGILLTTPESLEAMLSLRAPWARRALAGLRYVVIDELHSFLNSERGVQLQSLLRRVEQMVGRRIPRLAMSATLGHAEQAKLFLRPDGALPVEMPDDGAPKPLVSMTIKEYVASADSDPQRLIAEDIYRRLRGSNNLVFTNSRKDAEAFAVDLRQLSETDDVPNEFRIHHGSLSRLEREDVERELQRGATPTTAICTASMELGVDIGKVQSVAQIGTAGSPSLLRQRLGRSGRRGQPAVMRIYSIDEQRDDYKFHLYTNLVHNVAVTELLREGRYDPSARRDAFISIAVQQLLSLVAQYGSFYPAEAYRLLCEDGAFSMLTEEDFHLLLENLLKKNVLATLASGQLVVGTEGERLLRGRDFFSAFTAAKDYTIIERQTRKTIGSVQYKPYYGEVFILAAERWIVDAVEERSATVYVSRTVSKGKMMFEGTGPEASGEVVEKMLSIYRSDVKYPYLDASTGAPEALERAREWFRKQGLDEGSWLRHGDAAAYFTWAGMKANRTMALLARNVLSINPSYDHLAVSGLTPENVDAIARYVADAGPDLEQKLASSVNRLKKERGKYDPYLPESLLNREYAASRLDLPALQKSLKPLEI